MKRQKRPEKWVEVGQNEQVMGQTLNKNSLRQRFCKIIQFFVIGTQFSESQNLYDNGNVVSKEIKISSNNIYGVNK